MTFTPETITGNGMNKKTPKINCCKFTMKHLKSLRRFDEEYISGDFNPLFQSAFMRMTGGFIFQTALKYFLLLFIIHALAQTTWFPFLLQPIVIRNQNPMPIHRGICRSNASSSYTLDEPYILRIHNR